MDVFDFPNSFCKVWYNAEKNWFELFDKDGNPVSPSLDCSVTIDDNFSKRQRSVEEYTLIDKIVTVKFEIMAQMVTEMPTPKKDNA